MNQHVELLDCTLRDGSYAVDFQFTAADTAAICRALEAAGVRSIEIGHGFGLGASGPRLGVAAANDEEYIRAAAESLRTARFGAFFIPGVATARHLEMARAGGMHFIRVGTNIVHSDEARESIEHAKRLGFEVSYNAMKSYIVSPEELLDRARRAVEWGADSVSIVDSAGGMLPAEVGRYVGLLCEHLPVRIGFHGHNNFMLANANNLAALAAGATILDTTLGGIGRSGGNAPTESMAIVCQRLGRHTGIDKFKILDAMDLVEQIARERCQVPFAIQSIDVVMADALFHSSFLPRIDKVLEEFPVDRRQLILEVGKVDKVNPPPELIRRIASELAAKSGVQRAAPAEPKVLTIGAAPAAIPTAAQRIPVSGPSITAHEIGYVTDAVTRCWYSEANDYHQRFERAFADYVGTRYAVALPSCTSAIHLSLLTLGVGPGDEVIVPDVTWIASAAPVSYVGATPVFADIDPQSWCLSAESFERAVTPRTKAVIPVDLYGNMPDMDRIRAVAERHGIAIIEDAAEAIGSEYRGRKAGSFGDTGVFSFHGSKTLTTGEGGMLVTDRQDVYERVLVLRDHGRRPNDTTFRNFEVAHKYKMSNMQAALGLAQLERIDELVARKRQIFHWYREELEDLEQLSWNSEAPGTKNTYWMVTAVVDAKLGLTKEELIAEFDRVQVDCRPFFYPLSSLPAYAGTSQARLARGRNTASYAISPFGVNLPCGMNVTRETVGTVGRALRDVLIARQKGQARKHRAA